MRTKSSLWKRTDENNNNCRIECIENLEAICINDTTAFITISRKIFDYIPCRIFNRNRAILRMNNVELFAIPKHSHHHRTFNLLGLKYVRSGCMAFFRFRNHICSNMDPRTRNMAKNLYVCQFDRIRNRN